MLRTLRTVENCKVVATDGDIGTVVGFLIDDEHWVVRYLVVETGGFAGGRKLLISPISIRKRLLSNGSFLVGLTVDKVQYGPSLDLGEPISRGQELEYHRYYGYAKYWGNAKPWGTGHHPGALAIPRKDEASVEESADAISEVHVRADADVRGYHVWGRDGAIGRVADFVVNEDSWEICYLVVETNPWRLGPEVLIAPSWTEHANQAERTLQVDLSRQSVGASPDWNPLVRLEREYESRLYAHYQRRGYWEPGNTSSLR